MAMCSPTTKIFRISQPKNKLGWTTQGPDLFKASEVQSSVPCDWQQNQAVPINTLHMIKRPPDYSFYLLQNAFQLLGHLLSHHLLRIRLLVPLAGVATEAPPINLLGDESSSSSLVSSDRHLSPPFMFKSRTGVSLLEKLRWHITKDLGLMRVLPWFWPRS